MATTGRAEMTAIADDDERLVKGIPGHSYQTARDDGDTDCECGKWLEEMYYEFSHHIRDVLEYPEEWED
jgi:hypothetical protein